MEVYRHKGKILQRKYPSLKFIPVWLEKQRHSKRYYALNREHPILKDFISKNKGEEIGNLLKFIEETVPIPLITIKESENPESHGIPFEGASHELLLNKIKELFNQLISQGNDSDTAAAILLSMEPFDKYPQYIELLKEEK